MRSSGGGRSEGGRNARQGGGSGSGGNRGRGAPGQGRGRAPGGRSGDAGQGRGAGRSGRDAQPQGRGGPSQGRGGQPPRGRDAQSRGRDAQPQGRGGQGAGRPGGGQGGGGPKGSVRNGGGGRPARPKQSRPKQSRPGRSRELEAKIEAANRARHTDRVKHAAGPGSSAPVDGVRLQKVLAQAGLGSRRACEELIDQGRVEVNGQLVREQGLRIDPDRDELKVDGLTVETQGFLFFALNKPAGVVSTMEDPDGRQCLGDYVTNRETRLFHVGRLDTETEGLILLTNHGELSHRLTHPRYGVTKTYLAHVVGPIPRDLGKRLKAGIPLEDGLARADHFRILQNTGKNYMVEISLHEGRKHIVRRMLEEVGFPVEKLVRTHFGPIALGDQKSGWLRRLSNTEVGMLKKAVDL